MRESTVPGLEDKRFFEGDRGRVGKGDTAGLGVKMIFVWKMKYRRGSCEKVETQNRFTIQEEIPVTKDRRNH